jgi:hypothetical protein
MNAQETERAANALKTLFSAFPTSQKGELAQIARTYLHAVQPYSIDAIESAVGEFVSGTVPEHDGKFVPTTAQLARRVRHREEIQTLLHGRKGSNVIPYRIGEKPPAGAVPCGIVSVDFGDGRIPLEDLTHEEREEVLRTGKRLPADKSLVQTMKRV